MSVGALQVPSFRNNALVRYPECEYEAAFISGSLLTAELFIDERLGDPMYEIQVDEGIVMLKAGVVS